MYAGSKGRDRRHLIMESYWTPHIINRNYSAILATLQLTSYALGV